VKKLKREGYWVRGVDIKEHEFAPPPCPPDPPKLGGTGGGGLGAVRIARFENCYGPEGTWTGGREKAPAAICRKAISDFELRISDLILNCEFECG